MARRRPRQRSSARVLALVYALLVVYASLYPFAPWRWPPGVDLVQLALLPWPPWRDAFDVTANVLGYVPLGALLLLVAVRRGEAAWRALAWAIGLPVLMSYGLEVAQSFLQGRVPSRVDWALNSAGAVLGAGLAALLHRAGLLSRWQALRERWFVRDSAGGLALLALWPVALLWPAPVPLGLGHVGPALREALTGLMQDVPWAAPLLPLLASAGLWTAPLPPLAEALVQLLGMLAPCLLALDLARPGWRRGVLVLGAFAAALATTTLATALSFGPEHALAWASPLSLPAITLGVLLALPCALLNSRAVAGLGLAALAASVVLVAQAPVDPYFADSLQRWEQGRFIRFNGLAQWIGWLWPFCAMGWLLMRLGRRGD